MCSPTLPAVVNDRWLLARLDDPSVRVLQVDDDRFAFEVGHIPGASYVCWHTDLADPHSRDLLGAEAFAALMDRLGIGPHTTVVVYGDQMNLWAAYAWWVLHLWCHADVRLLDGGYAAWARAGLPMVAAPPAPLPTLPTTAQGAAERLAAEPSDHGAGAYPVPRGPRGQARARLAEVRCALDGGDATIVDARSPAGFQGEVPLGGLLPPLAGAIRAGHIPGAISVPWVSLVDPDTGLLLGEADLRGVFVEAGVSFDDPVIVYCEVGASSALVCLVLGEILGHRSVANYDGSWLEWAATIGSPVAR